MKQNPIFSDEIWLGKDGNVYLDPEVFGVTDIPTCKYTRADLSNAWQDISSAPRDGTEILVHCRTYYGVPFFYISRWRNEYGGFITTGSDGEISIIGKPLCWMPLPAPPTSQEGE